MPQDRESHWIEQYEGKDALWMHDGNPNRPHALLTSGKHSSGFFNSRRVIPDEELLREAASDLVDALIETGCDLKAVDGVVGPQTGATKLAEFLSDEIAKRTNKPCFHASPRKDVVDDEKVMVFSIEELARLAGKTVLLCEDVRTTGGSIERTKKAAVAAEAEVLRFVAMLVNRSGEREADGMLMVALISRHLPTWEPDECPLCKQRSMAIPAKDPVNWAMLNADYPRLCLALDGLELDKVMNLLEVLGEDIVAAKIHDLLDSQGPGVIELFERYDVDQVWVDYKLHDTPDTVNLRVKALIVNGADIVTVHASGGIPMMRKAVEASRTQDGVALAEIWAITVLTSLSDDEILRIYNRTRLDAVLNLALMAEEAGCDGLVCSALEVEMLSKESRLAGMKLVVPGTRSVGVALGQQTRSDTPANAIANGATYLVAGTQVTKAEDPAAAFKAMTDEINSAMG